MPINVSWYDNQQTIIILDFVEPHITEWSEYHTAVDEAIDLANSVIHPVGMIFYAKDTPMPQGAPLIELQRATSRMPEKVRRVVSVVAVNPFENLMLSILERLVRRIMPVYTVSTLEQAVSLLHDALQTK